MSINTYITDFAVVTSQGNLDESFLAYQNKNPEIERFGDWTCGLIPKVYLAEIESIQSRSKVEDKCLAIGIYLAERLKDSLDIRPDTGLVVGTSRGAAAAKFRSYGRFFGDESIGAKTSPVTTISSLSSVIAQRLGVSGSSLTVSSACSSGLNALGVSLAQLWSGLASHVVTGSMEACVNPFVLKALESAKVLARSDADFTLLGAPFGNSRSGLILAEGGALFSLAKEKGRNARAKILGFGSYTEKASLTGISPDAKALQKAIRRALEISELKSEQIDLIIAHGAGTRSGDRSELNCLRQVFSENMPYITCHKWVTGHSLGASSSISIALAIKHMESKQIVELPYPSILPHQDPPKVINRVLVCGLGFGGNASAVILEAVSP